MDSLNKKKYGEIEKLLTESQIKWLYEIKTILKAEQEKRITSKIKRKNN